MGGGTTNRSAAFVVYKNGSVDANGSNVHSDARVKTNVEPLGEVLSKLHEIRGVTYEFKDQERYPAGPQIEFNAQEVQAQFPEVVHETSNGYLSLSYEKFTAVLLEAVNEQQTQIEAQNECVAKRDAEVAALRAELEASRRELAATRTSLEDRMPRLEALLMPPAAGQAK